MTKVKVLHVTFDMTIGGAQQVIRQLVENMDETKIHSEVLCIDNKLGELGEILQEKGIKIYLLNRQSGFDFSLVKALNKIIKTNEFDVIHCHQYTPYIYGLLAAIITPAKVIFTEHGRFYPDFGTWKRKLFNPVFSLFTYKITAISQATKNALVKFENFKSKNIDVIYNGIIDKSNIKVDEKALKNQFNIPQNAFIFGTISRLQPIKNQVMMIRAFSEINEEHGNTHLLIVGDGESRKELYELSTNLKLNQFVTFTGFQRDPYIFHKIINVFLLPSFSEGASMTLLEGMSFSKPCIVTEVGGSPELIKDNVNGYVIPNNDINSLVKSANRLVENTDILQAFGEKGREIFERNFHVDFMIKKFTCLYLKVSKVNTN